MQNESDPAHPGTDDSGSGSGTDQQWEGGIGRSIRPGSPVPPMVLVADMTGGALLLQGWRTGPSAYLAARDATAVRDSLIAAFGGTPSPSDIAVAEENEQRTELPEHTVEPDWKP